MTCVMLHRHSDVAWAISTAVHAQPSTDVPQTAKVVAALTHPRNPSLGIQQPSTAESPSQALLSDGQLDTTVAFTVTGQSAAEPYRQLLPHHS